MTRAKFFLQFRNEGAQRTLALQRSLQRSQRFYRSGADRRTAAVLLLAGRQPDARLARPLTVIGRRQLAHCHRRLRQQGQFIDATTVTLFLICRIVRSPAEGRQ